MNKLKVGDKVKILRGPHGVPKAERKKVRNKVGIVKSVEASGVAIEVSVESDIECITWYYCLSHLELVEDQPSQNSLNNIKQDNKITFVSKLIDAGWNKTSDLRLCAGVNKVTYQRGNEKHYISFVTDKNQTSYHYNNCGDMTNRVDITTLDFNEFKKFAIKYCPEMFVLPFNFRQYLLDNGFVCKTDNDLVTVFIKHNVKIVLQHGGWTYCMDDIIYLQPTRDVADKMLKIVEIHKELENGNK